MDNVAVATIKLGSKDDLIRLCEKAADVKSGLIQIGQGCNTVNAKSIMDLLSLDLGKEMTLVIHSEKASVYKSQFDEWRVRRVATDDD